MGKKKLRKQKHAGGGTQAAKGAAARHGGRYDWTLLGLDLLILLPPFVFLSAVADSFRLPKLVVTSFLALAACSLLLLRLARRVGTRERPLYPPPWRASVLWAILPLLAVATVGLWTTEHAGVVARTLPGLWAGAAFLVAATVLLSSRDRRRTLQLLTWPACILAILALAQATGLWQPMDFEDAVSQRLAVTSLAGGAFDLAAYLLLPLLWCQRRIWVLGSAGDGAVKGRRWIWWLALISMGAGMVATQTLGVLVAAAVGSLVLWLLQLRAAGVPARRLLVAVTATTLAVVLTALAVAPLRQRLVSKARQIGRGEINVFLTGRLDGWRAGLFMAAERPLRGVGTGAYGREFGDARLALQERGVVFWPAHKQPYFANAHNDLVELAAECGVPGVLALAWLLFWLLRGLRRRSARAEGEDDTGTGADQEMGAAFLWAALAAVVVVSLTNFPWHLALIAFPWLLVVAEALDTGEDQAEGGGEGSLPPRIVVWILALLALLAAGQVFLHGKDRIGAQRLVRDTEGLAQEASRRGQMPGQLLDAALGMLRHAEMLDPELVSVKITRGGLFMVAGRDDAAERSYLEAAAMQNRAEIWVNLARLRLRNGDTAGALEAARTARALGISMRRDLPEFRRLLREE